MPTTVEVVSPVEYMSRIEGLSGQDQAGDAQLALGRQSWERTCAKCHGPAGQGDLGPPIARSGTLVDAEALRTLLDEGLDTPGFEGSMPPVGRGWPEFQLDALIEYIRSNDDLAPPEQDGGGSG
jgi:mono/diheme cytochrome c family protein